MPSANFIEIELDPFLHAETQEIWGDRFLGTITQPSNLS